MLDTILKLALNYLVIQMSIILFIAPFYWRYSRKHQHTNDANLSLSQRLEYFFESKHANYLVFWWAFGEAIVWFVIPEFLLLLLIFMRIQKKRQLLLYDIYGTAVGTLIAYVIHLPQTWILHLPYIKHGMILQTKDWYDHLGILGLIYQPFSGVPYKVFTHLAADYHFFIPAFLLFAVIIRISRYYIAYVILKSIYPFLHKYVYHNYVPLFIVSSLIFSLLL